MAGSTGSLPDGTRYATRVPGDAAIKAIRHRSGRSLGRHHPGVTPLRRGRGLLPGLSPRPRATPPRSATTPPMALHLDRSGRLWVGTQSGLNRYDAGDGRLHARRPERWPPQRRRSTRFSEDDAGRLWVSTNRGLARYDESAADRVFVPTPSPTGWATSSSTATPPCRDATGTMYFGGDRGVTVFHPDALRGPALRPPIVASPHCTARRERGPRRARYVRPRGSDAGARA